jgi:PST family polysaccharide transporter
MIATSFDANIRWNIILNLLLQLTNMLAPLMLVPLLFSRLGAEVYGKLIYLLSIAGFLTAIIDAGLANYCSSRVARLEEQERNDFFLCVQALKLFFFFAMISILFIVLSVFGSSFSYSEWLLVIGYILLGVLSPYWYFLGIEKLGKITLLTGIGKLISLVLAFLVVDDDGSLKEALFVYIVSLVLPLLILKNFRYREMISSRGRFVAKSAGLLSDAYPLLLSNFGVSLYTNLNGFFVASFLGYGAAGLFGAAERVVKGAQQVVTSVSQAMIGRFSTSNSFALTNGYLKSIFILCALTAFSLYIAASTALPMIGLGEAEIISMTRQLSVVIFLGGCSSSLGIAYLLPREDLKFMASTILGAGFLNVALLYIFSLSFGQSGVVAAIILTEMMILLIFAMRCRMMASKIV